MEGLSGSDPFGWELVKFEHGTSVAQFSLTGSWSSFLGVISHSGTSRGLAQFAGTAPPSIARIIEAEIKFPVGSTGRKTAGVFFGAEAGSLSYVPPVDMGMTGIAAMLALDTAIYPETGHVLGDWIKLRMFEGAGRAIVWIDGAQVDVATCEAIDGSARTLAPTSGFGGIFSISVANDHYPQFRNVRAYLAPLNPGGLS